MICTTDQDIIPLLHYLFFIFVIFHRNGEEWQRIRNAVAPKVMRPKVLEENIENFIAVTKDAVERMVEIRDSNDEVPNLEGELSKWSTEGKAIKFPVY